MRIHHGFFFCLIKMFRLCTDLQSAMYEQLIQLMHDECLTHMLTSDSWFIYQNKTQTLEPYTL